MFKGVLVMPTEFNTPENYYYYYYLDKRLEQLFLSV